MLAIDLADSTLDLIDARFIALNYLDGEIIIGNGEIELNPVALGQLMKLESAGSAVAYLGCLADRECYVEDSDALIFTINFLDIAVEFRAGVVICYFEPVGNQNSLVIDDALSLYLAIYSQYLAHDGFDTCFLMSKDINAIDGKAVTGIESCDDALDIESGPFLKAGLINNSQLICIQLHVDRVGRCSDMDQFACNRNTFSMRKANCELADVQRGGN